MQTTWKVEASRALSDAAKSLGVTQSELARRTERNRAALNQKMLGHRELSIAEFCELSLALGIKPSALLASAESAMKTALANPTNKTAS